MNDMKHCSKSHDSDFNKIEGLSWLPWVGERFNETKTLVIGESQYEDGDCWQKGNPNSTRTLIGKRFEDSRARIYLNTEKILLNNRNPTNEEALYIWKSVAYCNLVQRLMTSRKDRPTHEDLDFGWKMFFKLCSILKPETCIVLGKSICGRLGYYLNNNETIWKRTVSEFYEKEKIINLISSDRKMKLVFINHPSGSHGFSINKWMEFVNENDPKLQKLFNLNEPHSR